MIGEERRAGVNTGGEHGKPWWAKTGAEIAQARRDEAKIDYFARRQIAGMRKLGVYGDYRNDLRRAGAKAPR